MNLADQVVELHHRFDGASIPHAFGGALALAWCTQRARATIDVDVNLFVDSTRLDDIEGALSPMVALPAVDRKRLAAEGQTRLWWDQTPVDVFLNTTSFHEQAATRFRIERFNGAAVPFLACQDLAVFKAFFNRTKDWADLEEMAFAHTLDVPAVIGILALFLGGADDRIERLRVLHQQQ
jgi:hypothetical protein